MSQITVSLSQDNVWISKLYKDSIKKIVKSYLTNETKLKGTSKFQQDQLILHKIAKDILKLKKIENSKDLNLGSQLNLSAEKSDSQPKILPK